jgi:hypothetical protein
MDGLDELWWNLPGPARFTNQVSETALDPRRGIIGLALPGAPIIGMFDALGRTLRDRSSRWVLKPDLSQGLGGRTPMKALAAEAGIEAVGLNRAADFVWHPELSEAVFLVEKVRREDWASWALFARSVEAELTKGERFSTPSVILVLPRGFARAETEAMLGKPPIRWYGCVSRLDTRLFVEQIRPTEHDDLLHRVATETTVELAGWDRDLAASLATMEVEDRVYPFDKLESNLSGWSGQQPSWDNALVDIWEGMPFTHTLTLLASGDIADRRIVATRLWAARTRVIFPFLEQLRHAFIRKYERVLRNHLPYPKHVGAGALMLDHAQDLEIAHLRRILFPHLGNDSLDAILLNAMTQLRHALAHVNQTDVDTIRLASELWEDISHTFPGECDGWDWPRCGQKLTILIGPAGAGKSMWAEANYPKDDIVSTDAIRNQLFGNETALGDPAPVFLMLRRMVVDRLSMGRSVVVDATNIKSADRLANARLAPPDFKVEYVVIDRSHADKRRDGGWRNERGLIEKHAAQFSEELDAIMRGDGLPNVEVIIPTLDGASVVPQMAELQAGEEDAAA